MYIPKINKDVTGITFTDELHSNVGANAFGIDHDYFLAGADLVIRDAAGGGGNLLVEGVGNDYVTELQNSPLEDEVNVAIGPGKTVYKNIKIVNATYQTGNTYSSGKYIADDNSYTDVEYLKRHSNKFNILSTPYSIGEADNYSLYKVTTAGSLNIVNLPAAADAEDQVFKIRKEDTGVGCVRLTPDGSEKIVASSGAELSYLFLFTKGDLVEVMSNGTDWFIINSFKPYFESGWINRSDWTNVHLGFAQVAYTGASGTFTIGENVSESTSGNTGILIHDSGTVFTFVSVTNTGVFTNAETLTGGTSAETATVNGNTKNVDTDILHNWGVDIKYLLVDYRISSDGTENNAKSMNSGNTTNGIGMILFQIDVNSAKLQTGSIAAGDVCDDNGTANNISTDDIYGNFKLTL